MQLLQSCNTVTPLLLHLNLNPAQLMLHRTLCDQLPTNLKYYELHQEWIISADEHEKALAKRNEEILTRYNKTAKTLPELSIGTQVLMHQSKKRSTPQWIKTAEIIRKLPNRQYKVKCHATGRVTSRNRRFNKPLPTPHQFIPQKGTPYVGPFLWNKLDNSLKISASLNTFKHNLKNQYFRIKTTKR